MKKFDAEESVPIIERTMTKLLSTVQTHGRAGADVRNAVGDLLAHSRQLLHDDAAGEPMAECFDKARVAGVTMPQFLSVLDVTTAETPTSLGGTLTKHSLIAFDLASLSRVISDVVFNSRQDVDAVRNKMHNVFAIVEEAAADAMDAMTYRALIELHAAVMFHLVETARPLPRVIRFQFARPLPTLVTSYRLYDDASRANEIRAENRIVHPAFGPRIGLALSA